MPERIRKPTPAQLAAMEKRTTRLEQLRATRAALERQVEAAAADVTRLRRERASLQSEGARGRTVAALDRKLDKAATTHRRLVDTIAALDRTVVDVRDRLDDLVIGLADPVAALDGGLPVALFPVRIETRFVGSELRVRVYPDVLQIDQLEPLVTAEEEAYGQRYWVDRWHLRDRADIDACWERFLAGHQPNRFAWIVQATTPTNVASIGSGEPAFPTLELRSTGPSRTPRAALLPARWLVLGYRDSAEVLRTWGPFVVDPLSVGVAAPSAASTPTDGTTEPPAPEPLPGVQESLAIDDHARWLTDYDAALASGMAITVQDRDVQGGLAAGFDELLVLGVDHRRDPQAAAAHLEATLSAHRFTSGLSFVPAGTPTNAATDESIDPRPLASDPSVPPPPSPADAAAPTAARALGLAADSTLSRLAGADTVLSPATADLHTALWEATLGYFLRQVMSPLASDAQIGQVRDHFRRYVRPRGSLPLLRAGRQPVGLLPVVALDRFRGDGAEQLVGEVLRQIRPLWSYPARRARQLGDSGDPAADLVELLEQTSRSVAYRVREVLGPGSVANSTGAERLNAFQQVVAQLVLALTGVTSVRPAVVDWTLLDDQTVLPVPLVTGAALSKSAGLDPDYVQGVLDAVSRRGGFASTLSHPSTAATLLEALLLHAATLETTRATTGLVLEQLDLDLPIGVALRDDEVHLDVITLEGDRARAARPATARARRAAITVEGAGTAGAKLSVDTLALANQPVASISGRSTLANHVAELSLGDLRRVTATRQLSEFRASLERLVGTPTAELHRTTADALDAVSYRYDAWATSLATRRLDNLRQRNATGIHLGGFGWVEQLKPSTRPVSMGYIHGPSIAHATTAAILRSGHLARGDGTAEPLSIDLSSRRVRDARKLIDGMRAGQSLGALLGYRFERGLRDRGAVYAQYILPTRQRFSLAEATDSGTGDQPLEAIAASNVADGLRLAELDATGRDALLTSIGAASEHVVGVRAQLDALADALDALGDLLVSESVFQAVLGNTERAAAALDALDRQVAIPEVSVARTPRTGVGLGHRLLVVLDADRPPARWSGLVDVRSTAEPRVNAWAGRVLGDPGRFRFAADVLDDDGDVLETLSVSLTDLGMSPLSAVLSVARGSGEASEFEERLAIAFASRVTDDDAAGLRAHEGLAPDAPAGSVGLVEFVGSARRVADLLSSSRAATARDFAPDTERVETGVDVDELVLRADVVRGALEGVAAVNPTDSSLTTAQMMTTLAAAADLGMRDSLARSDDPDDLAGQLVAVVESGRRLLDGLNQIEAAVPDPTTASTDALVRLHTDRIRQVLGADFPVVPVAELPERVRDQLGPSAAETALLDGAPLAATEWLLQHSRVRPAVERLWSVLTDAELRGSGIDATQLHVAQLPHAPGERWIGRQLVDAGVVPAATVSLVLHRAGDVADPAVFGTTVAALAVDQWHERIPSASETTGISFHFDGPGARPPQSVLLAVPPEPDAQRWSLDALVDTVREAMELTRIRTLDLDDLPGVGRFLPALYFAFDLERSVPSLNVTDLVATSLGKWGYVDNIRINVEIED